MNLSKIKTYSYMSLDGFVSQTDGDFDRLLNYPRPAQGDYGYCRFCASISCCLMSPIHYSTLQSYDIRLPSDKPCHIIQTDVDDEDIIIDQVKSLLKKSTGDLWLVGDTYLTSVLVEHALIDEMVVIVVPVILGSGLPLFGKNGTTEQDLTLKKCTPCDNGVVVMEYAVNYLFI